MLKFFSVLLLLASQLLLADAFTNPIKERDGSDPFIVYDQGYYYLTTTTWTNLQITRATTIGGLKIATPKVVWTDTTASRCCNMWAPEIHWQPNEGAWFLYYSAGTRNVDNQRMHALRSSSSNIWNSTWSYAGKLTEPNREGWSIDHTVLVVGNARYLVFSSYEGAMGTNQSLWIAPMTSATTIGNSVKISTPTLSWETITAPVNEGPAPLYHGGRTWIVYSASHCYGTGYRLGRLELTGSNPLNPSSWTKYGSPIFLTANGNYQPGHNGFFVGPSGNNIYNVYHADVKAGGVCDGARFTAVAPVTWNPDGTPNLGAPPPLNSEIPEPV
ncbi:hypothetical protein AX16_001716 [Volvariella volvacea WC 439]|nr:hypothetical protein AX16_001716 [Volvariella volvacea WC 439]